jgi:hypothetical protein
MDYLKQLNELRNDLHKKIVYLAIKSVSPGSDYVLELEDPLEASFTVRSRETGDLVTTQVTVMGVDGTTGELVASTANGTGKKLYYNDLTLEQLARLFTYLEQKLFTITEKEYVRHLITAG